MPTPGALMLTPGALMPTPGALMPTPGALMPTPGAELKNWCMRSEVAHPPVLHPVYPFETKLNTRQ